MQEGKSFKERIKEEIEEQKKNRMWKLEEIWKLEERKDKEKGKCKKETVFNKRGNVKVERIKEREKNRRDIKSERIKETERKIGGI